MGCCQAASRAARGQGLAVLLLLVVAGCDARFTLDTSSRVKFDASLKSMTRGMSRQDRFQFGQDCGAAAMRKTRGLAMGSALMSGYDPVEVLKPLDGMTLSEIRALAEEYRSKGAWGN